MSNPSFKPHEGDRYQDIANGAALAVLALCHSFHSSVAAKTGSTDGGPLVQGVIAGLLRFALDGDTDLKSLRRSILKTIDQVGPQIVMSNRAQVAGTTTTGTA